MQMTPIVSIASGPSIERESAAPNNFGCLYTENDTNKVYYSNGISWRLMGFASGGASLPGVTSLEPNGIAVAGGANFGDPAAATVPFFLTSFGCLQATDTPGNNVNADSPLQVNQESAVTDTLGVWAVIIDRSGDISAHDYIKPTVTIADETASAQPLLEVQKQNIVLFQIDSDGVRVHGKFKTGAAVTRTLGAYSGKSLPIYDEAGTLVGYAPLYA